MDNLARWLALILGWLISGKLLADNGRSDRELERVEKAMRVAREHRSDTFDERVQRLARRGRLRGVRGK